MPVWLGQGGQGGEGREGDEGRVAVGQFTQVLVDHSRELCWKSSRF